MNKLLFIILTLNLVILTGCAQEQQDDRPLKPPKGYANETFLKISHVLGFLDLVETEPAVPEELDEYKDIVYKELETGDLKLDIYKRKDLNGPTPVLVFIHGGGWSKGKKEDYLIYLVDFAMKGYVTVSISYRLFDVAKFPAPVQDVKCAINWIRNNADEYMINREKMAVIGGSAGGHLTMMLAYSEEDEYTEDCDTASIQKPQAIVDIYGPVDLTTEYAKGRGETKGLIGKLYEENPGAYKAASPVSYISDDDPPTLIFHGTIDSLVPVSQSDSLQIWLDNAGIENEYHRLKGWPHTMDLSEDVNEYFQFYMDRFFEKHLLNE
ncbi:MAG: alpha/beta hydrolase [Bacteroidota bacterium]